MLSLPFLYLHDLERNYAHKGILQLKDLSGKSSGMGPPTLKCNEGGGLTQVGKGLMPHVGPEIIGMPDLGEHTGLVSTLNVNNGVRTSLIIPMYIKGENGDIIPLQVLIDTGCEMDLMDQRIVP